jgi:hypothetical protein
MSIRSGLAAQFGFAAETTVGTRVTVTSFLPIISESYKRNDPRLESDAIRVGRLVETSNEWAAGQISIGGDIALELNVKDMRPILTAMFGSETGASPYTYTPGDLYGQALTFQFGRPDVSGTVQPFTYAGNKIESWEIACAAGKIATLGLTGVSCLVDETTGVGLASASYTSGQKPFNFAGATLSIGGTTTNVNQLTIGGNNGLETRFFNGSAYTKEPIATKLREYKGALVAEFESLTNYNLFVNGTEGALVASFVNGSSSLIITQNVRFDGETPNIGGRGITKLNLPYKAIASSAADSSAITAVYTP